MWEQSEPRDAAARGELARRPPAKAALAGQVAEGASQADRRRSDVQMAAFIAQAVAYSTGVGASEIADLTGRRGAPAARARQIAMYLAHTNLSWPLWRVGEAFNRDRTTAGHACAVVERLRDDREFDRRLEEVEACLAAAPASSALPLIL